MAILFNDFVCKSLSDRADRWYGPSALRNIGTLCYEGESCPSSKVHQLKVHDKLLTFLRIGSSDSKASFKLVRSETIVRSNTIDVLVIQLFDSRLTLTGNLKYRKHTEQDKTLDYLKWSHLGRKKSIFKILSSIENPEKNLCMFPDFPSND